MFDTEAFLKNYQMFWQYPVKTEEEFYIQNKDNPNYLGLPWATFLDKSVNHNALVKALLPLIKTKNTYTCCQHIYFKKLIPIMKIIGVKALYTPHKVIGEDEIHGVYIYPCPLYAVNVEDNARNQEFQKVDFNTIERKYLYSFMGGYQPSNYLTKIRKNIFEMKHPDDAFVLNTGSWHFNNVVYSNKQNTKKELNIDNNHIQKTKNYNKLLLESRFSLCPSGSGPNSIRFWESLAVGSIPILLADTLELPEHSLWENAIIKLEESKLKTLPELLSKISEEKEKEMRKNCIQLYNYYKNNYRNCKHNIIHYCCGSYDKGHYGGVARYDYHVSLVFPHRIFIKGPEQKNKLISLLEKIQNTIVFTDNHLACDIPNKYRTILVHHGSALTHAEREPLWNKYWKDLCCNGQKQMLSYRDINTTKILSCSTFCIDEFSKFFPNIYREFKKSTILHTSELNEKIYKQKWNDKPRVLGNWKDINKGKDVVQILQKEQDYIFNDLKVSPINGNIKDFNKRKQDIYLQSDVFLQLSLCEGNSYSTLDALLCGIPVVSSNVGLFYKDVPDDCFVKIEWERNNDIKYVKSKLEYALKHKETIGKKGRNWYLNNCNIKKWKTQMNKLVN